MTSDHEKLREITRVPIPALDGVSIPGAVEATERAGQTAFVADINALPIKVESDETDETYTALGFFFGEPIDKLFREARLPDGWKKSATDHDMWSHIVDATGVVRVEVFYKAAFYDRRAFMRLAEPPTS